MVRTLNGEVVDSFEAVYVEDPVAIDTCEHENECSIRAVVRRVVVNASVVFSAICWYSDRDIFNLSLHSISSIVPVLGCLLVCIQFSLAAAGSLRGLVVNY